MRSDSAYVMGALFGLAAATIWASWSTFTRLAVTTRLDAWDIATLRFGVAGLVLTPVVLRRGLALDRLGRAGLAAIIVGGGAPYGLLAAAGLRLAPAGGLSALNPGFVPLFVALISAVAIGEKFSPVRKLGLSLIFAGALLIVGWMPRARAARAASAMRSACSPPCCGHASPSLCGKRNSILFMPPRLSPPDRW